MESSIQNCQQSDGGGGGTSSRHQLGNAFNREWHSRFHRLRDLMASLCVCRLNKKNKTFPVVSVSIDLDSWWPGFLIHKRSWNCVCVCTHSDVGKEQAVKTASNARIWAVVIVALLNRWHHLLPPPPLSWKSWLKRKLVTTLDRNFGPESQEQKRNKEKFRDIFLERHKIETDLLLFFFFVERTLDHPRKIENVDSLWRRKFDGVRARTISIFISFFFLC